MKFKTFTFLKHKTYLFSFMVLMLGSILSSLPAYSQVDYYYGVNKKGIRVGLGVGESILQSNWSYNPVGITGLVALDYDLNPYTTIGIQGQYGMMTGRDMKNKFYYYKTDVVFAGGNLNIKVAIGQFADFKTHNMLQDALKRFYVGVGAGMVNSAVTLTRHADVDQQGLPSDNIPGVAVAKTITPLTYNNSKKGYTGNSTFTYFPVNVGTNIALRGLFGSDKIDLNPNFQYSFVMSPIFDGYQPNTDKTTQAGVNGDQQFMVISLALRYKF